MFKPELEYAFTMQVDLGHREHWGPTPAGGGRAFVPVLGGTIDGPLLTGKVRPYGGDWPYVRMDNVVVFDAHYGWEASDGTLIHVRNQGYRHSTKEVMDRLAAGETMDPRNYYHRSSPTFDCVVGPHDWLTRTMFVCVGDRQHAEATFHYFAVR
jgi:hypothetical protein